MLATDWGCVRAYAPLGEVDAFDLGRYGELEAAPVLVLQVQRRLNSTRAMLSEHPLISRGDAASHGQRLLD